MTGATVEIRLASRLGASALPAARFGAFRMGLGGDPPASGFASAGLAVEVGIAGGS
jgi:hypothetical protein